MTEGTTIAFPVANRRLPATRPDRAAEIRAVALEIHTCRFVACRDQEYSFTQGTILAWLHKNGRLKETHLKAAQRVIEDLRFAAGRIKGRVTTADDTFDKLQALIDETLTPEERLLFVDVFTRDYFQPHTSVELAQIGKTLSGYHMARRRRIPRLWHASRRFWSVSQPTMRISTCPARELWLASA